MKQLDQAHKFSSLVYITLLILVRTIEPEVITIISNLIMDEYPINFDLLC